MMTIKALYDFILTKIEFVLKANGGSILIN